MVGRCGKKNGKTQSLRLPGLANLAPGKVKRLGERAQLPWRRRSSRQATPGAGRGELPALTWPDLNMTTGELSVSKSLEQTRAGLRVKGTKSDKPRYFVAPEPELPVLAEHRAQGAHVKELVVAVAAAHVRHGAPSQCRPARGGFPARCPPIAGRRRRSGTTRWAT